MLHHVKCAKKCTKNAPKTFPIAGQRFARQSVNFEEETQLLMAEYRVSQQSQAALLGGPVPIAFAFGLAFLTRGLNSLSILPPPSPICSGLSGRAAARVYCKSQKRSATPTVIKKVTAFANSRRETEIP